MLKLNALKKDIPATLKMEIMHVMTFKMNILLILETKIILKLQTYTKISL